MSGCARARTWISRSVDGDLTPVEALRLARHLSTCTACRILEAREARLAQMLDDVGDVVPVDESFFDAVMASLPERAPVATIEAQRKARWRRGLRLAAFASVTALGAGIAARVLPSLQLDVATPAMPRFTPEDADGLVSFLGSAVQWIRMTAQSMAWAGSTGSFSPWAIGAVSLGAAVVGAATLLAVSGALAWATRTSSRPS
jgi:predicted anti-sigma-YlaC factor YlaD